MSDWVDYIKYPLWVSKTSETKRKQRKDRLMIDSLDCLLFKQIIKPNPLLVNIQNLTRHSKYKISYNMELLYPLTDDERMIIDLHPIWTFCTENMHNKSVSKKKQLSEEKVKQLLNQYRKQSKYKDLFAFIRKIKKLGYEDLHSGNIGISIDNQYKLMDLEGFVAFYE